MKLPKTVFDLPIQHSFDPITGQHLDCCIYADILYVQMIENMKVQNHQPLFIDNSSA